MLRSLEIKNFKGWADTKLIHLAPITLFFGNNSSGKSSIGQFLLLLKQTAESPDRKAVLFGGDENTPVNVGAYADFVHRRDVKQTLSFCLEWAPDSGFAVRDRGSEPQRDFSGDLLRFCAGILPQPEIPSVPAVDWFEYSLLSGKERTVQLALGMKRKPEASKYTLTAKVFQPKRRVGRAWDLGSPNRFYGFPDEVAGYFQNVEIAQDFSLGLEKFFRRICYLGPLRERARRLYTWSGLEPSSVGYAGENWIGALLAAKRQNRRLNLEKNKRKKSFEEIIAGSLQKLGVIDAFEVKSVAKDRRDYEVKVRTPGSTDWIDLVDVGFGVSQVLPFLVEAFYAPPGSIILVEQPELHLHPKAQTNLADVVIDMVQACEDGADRGIQLIIESHSEHFLQRLQRRIAEGTLARERLAAYFSSVEGDSAHLNPLRIDPRGNIENWPQDFFGDLMGEAVAMSRAQAAR